jgi:hypothetical protein
MLEMMNILKEAARCTLATVSSDSASLDFHISKTVDNYVKVFPVEFHGLCSPSSERSMLNPASSSLRSIAATYVLLSECLITGDDIMSAYEGVPLANQHICN